MNQIERIMALADHHASTKYSFAHVPSKVEEARQALRAAIEQAMNTCGSGAGCLYKDARIEALEQALGAGEPVAYMHCPSVAMNGKVRPVLSFEKYEGDYASGIYAERIPLFTAPKPQPRQEPFGYFRAEPFGWTDCSPDDEGSIPLFEAPQPQRDSETAMRLAGKLEMAEREVADLKRQIESMHYDLDAMSVIKGDRDECHVVMRQALEALVDADRLLDDEGYGHAFQQEAIAALKEQLK